MPGHATYNRNAAQLALDEALARVERGAPEDWTASALDAIRTVAAIRREFTADAPAFLLDRWGVVPPPDERAWGPVFQRAARLGLIAKTGRWVKSVKAACHRREKPVWRSLTYAAAATAGKLAGPGVS